MKAQDTPVTLFEKYRPRTWGEVLGQDKAVRELLCLRDHSPIGFAGRMYWIQGPTGTGKTTIARIMANEITGGTAIAIEEYDAQSISLERVRELHTGIRMGCLFGNGNHVLIINEAHQLNKRLITFFLNASEPLPRNLTWIPAPSCPVVLGFT